MKKFLSSLIRAYYDLKEIRDTVKAEKERNKQKLLQADEEFNNLLNAIAWRNKYENLLAEFNKLISIINEKGGQQFLDHGAIEPKGLDLTQDDLKIIIQLCHPDRHGGKESATEITKKLLLLRT